MPLELTPLDANLLTPMAQKALSAPGPAKMMAARGMAPMGPKDLVMVLYQLSFDAEEPVRQAAKKTAEGLPDGILSSVLSEALDVCVLDFFAKRLAKRGQLIEKILLNKATHDETLIYLGGVIEDREVEILAANHDRILKCPEIIESLYFNKQARMSTVKKLMELAVRNGLNLEKLPMFKEVAASILGEADQDAPSGIEQTQSPQGDLSVGDGVADSDLDAAFNSAMAMEEMSDEVLEDMEYEESKKKDAITQLTDLPLAAKMRLASIGSATHRAILVRDSNKMVCMAVIKSPAVSEQEVIRFAGNRSLIEDVVRYIANRKEWQKNYQIKLNLVNNPKCPLANALRLLTQLRQNDLRNLARSKNIPSALSTAAKRLSRERSK